MVGDECSNPLCTNEGSLICTACRLVQYCGQPCQKADWRRHKKECKAAKARRSSLIDPDTGDITDAFARAIGEVFTRLDEDKDGVLNTAELHSLSKICNDGEDFTEEDLEQIREFHEWSNGGLTLNGLKALFHTQAGSRPEDVWADLRALGFAGPDDLPKEVGAGRAAR